MAKSRPMTGLITVALALILTACGSTTSAPPTSQTAGSPAPAKPARKQKTKLVVTQALAPGSISSAPYYIGQALGYWDEENIDVDVQSLAGGASRGVELVLAGSADTVSILPDGLLVPTSKGQDIGLSWVYGVYQRPTHQLAVLANSDIKDVRQLAGKTVGMSALGPPAQTFFEAWLQRAGVDSSQVKETAVGNSPAAAEALRSGQVQALVQSAGDLTTFETQGYDFHWFQHPPELDALFGAGFVIKRDLPADKRDAMGRYLRTFTKSVVFAKENPTAAVRIMWNLFPAAVPKGIDEATALQNGSKILKSMLDAVDKSPDGRWGYISKERWQGYVKYLGLEAKIPDADKLLDDGLLPTINQFDATKVIEQARNYKK